MVDFWPYLKHKKRQKQNKNIKEIEKIKIESEKTNK
jgi:hypothetical protein